MNEELIEKCRLTDEEFSSIYGDFEAWQTAADLASLMMDKLLAKAIPLISAEARKQAYTEVGEALCQLIGEVMLDDVGEGQKLGNYLRATLKVCQERAGVALKEGKEAE